MSDISKTVIFSAIIGPIIAGFILFGGQKLLSQQKADLRYELSNAIPVGGNDSTKLVQQLDIQNAGNAVAQKIQIKIEKAVDPVVVQKDFYDDAFYQRNPTPGLTVIDYELLRPTGHIKIILHESAALSDQDIDVRDEDGPANRGFPTTSTYGLISNLILWGCLVWFVWSSGRHWATADFLAKCRWSPLDTIRSQPSFWLPRKYWTEGLKDAARYTARIEFSETNDPATWACVKLLNGDRPKAIPDDLWDDLAKILGESYLTRMTIAATDDQIIGTCARIELLFKAPAPPRIPADKYAKAKDDLRKFFLAALLRNIVTYNSLNVERIKNAIERIKLADFLSEREKSSSIEELQGLLFAQLIRELEGAFDLDKISSSPAIDYLGDDLKQKIKKLIYEIQMLRLFPITKIYDAKRVLQEGKPKFLSDTDYKRREAAARAIIDAEKSEQDAKALLSLLRGMFNGGNPPESAPDGVSSDEWAKIKEIAGKVSSLSAKENELITAEAKCSAERDQVSLLKTKLIRQLDTIERVLGDPGSVDRIESYDDLFAPGNLANLKKVAEFSKKANL